MTDGATMPASPAFRSAEHDVLKQHHEEPEREASRCLVRAAVLVLSGMISCPTASCQGDRCDACMLQCAHTEADGSAPCKGDHIHDDRCSDRHCPHSQAGGCGLGFDLPG